MTEAGFCGSLLRLFLIGLASMTPHQSKPAKVVIVAMGDSTRPGRRRSSRRARRRRDGSGDETSQYAYWLMKAHPDWDVVNQGINGAAQRSDPRALRRRTSSARRPAVVVIIAGVNDVYQGRAARARRGPARRHVPARPRGRHPRRRRQDHPLQHGDAEQNARMHEINDWIRKLGCAPIRRHRFVDTRAAVSAPGHPDLLAGSPDGLHPGRRGLPQDGRGDCEVGRRESFGLISEH